MAKLNNKVTLLLVMENSPSLFLLPHPGPGLLHFQALVLDADPSVIAWDWEGVDMVHDLGWANGFWSSQRGFGWTAAPLQPRVSIGSALWSPLLFFFFDGQVPWAWKRGEELFSWLEIDKLGKGDHDSYSRYNGNRHLQQPKLINN